MPVHAQKIKEDRCPSKNTKCTHPSLLYRLRILPHGHLLEGCGDWRPYDRNVPAYRAELEVKSAKGRVDGSLVGQKARKLDEPG